MNDKDCIMKNFKSRKLGGKFAEIVANLFFREIFIAVRVTKSAKLFTFYIFHVTLKFVPNVARAGPTYNRSNNLFIIDHLISKFEI